MYQHNKYTHVHSNFYLYNSHRHIIELNIESYVPTKHRHCLYQLSVERHTHIRNSDTSYVSSINHRSQLSEAPIDQGKHWGTDWGTNRPRNRQRDRPRDQPIDQPTDQPTNQPANRLTDRLTDRLTWWNHEMLLHLKIRDLWWHWVMALSDGK